jgi:predicted ATPase
MRFAKIHLENWRNFTRVDVPLLQRMFLIGPNASGKSNLLDAFHFLRDLVRVGRIASAPGRWQG